MYQRIIRLMAIAMILSITQMPASAQFYEEEGEEETDPGDGDGSVPIDGGLSLLLGAGAAYGAYRLRRKEKPGH